MKKILLTAILTLIGILTTTAQVGIGTETPEASAALEIKSTSQGLLPPRMTETERDAISDPATGLMIFNTTSSQVNYYTGSFWFSMQGELAESGIYPEGFVSCNGVVTVVVEVTNPNTGRTWMDRNLGASQLATSSTDYLSYGDLYQWGRGPDGHQCRDSQTTTDLSSSDHSGHGDFITTSTSPYDWRSPQNDNLWQGVNGINNPCPSGYRLPTAAELDAERQTWSSNDAAGAFASPLKFSLAGFRRPSSPESGGYSGDYWSSTVSGANSTDLYITSSNAVMDDYSRDYGYSVRCLKD